MLLHFSSEIKSGSVQLNTTTDRVGKNMLPKIPRRLYQGNLRFAEFIPEITDLKNYKMCFKKSAISDNS